MPIDMNALARAGAMARLAELQREITDIHAAFPDLREATATRGRSAKQVAEVPLPRKRRGMSAAAKKAVGERMKAYWAKRKGTALAAEPAVATAPTPAAKPAAKRTLSAEGRARISAAAKRRWRAQRKAKKA